MNKISFNIIGAGAIGHLWGCYLNQQNIDFNIYVKDQRSEQKINVKSPSQQFNVNMKYNILQNWKTADVILICVKAHQLERLCQSLPVSIFDNQLVFLMMNGLGLLETIKRYFPLANVFQAYITHGVFLSPASTNVPENGKLQMPSQYPSLVHTGNGETLIGNLNKDIKPYLLDPVISTMNEILPITSWQESHQEKLLLKLIINAVINPLTALKNCSNGDLLIRNKLIPEANALLLELAPIIGKGLPAYSIDQVKKCIEDVLVKTRNNFSSMHQDVTRNKQTEIDFINGYLVNYAAEMSVVLPLHEQIIIQIKKLLHETN